MWAKALVVVRFDELLGQRIQGYFPPYSLSEQVMKNIQDLAMPDCYNLNSGRDSLKYSFRVANEENSGQFFNCYVFFRHRRDPTSTRGFCQESVVLVSEYSFESLSFAISERLYEVLVALFF